MEHDSPSSQWSKPEILDRLRAATAKGQSVKAQVFLNDDLPADDLHQLATKIVESAKKKVGKHAAAELRKIHQLAKSFSIEADVDTLAEVANAPGVKTILPSEIPDVLPRPRNVGPV
jgi:hypothetical protein